MTGLPKSYASYLDTNYHLEDETGTNTRPCLVCGWRFEIHGTGFVKCPRCGAVHFAFHSFPPTNDDELCLMLY